MDVGGTPPAGKRRVMVIADPGRESAGALEWALYHAVLEHDEIVLLHVEPPNGRRGAFSTFLRRPSSVAPSSPAGSAAGSAECGGGDYEFLDAMRAACKAAQPKVKVQIERVETEAKDKATTILMQANLLRVDLLVIGQRRNQSTFLGYKLGEGLEARQTKGWTLRSS
ncbi:uncharacterized protein [Elaeis guineensis]|uniref:uncharacterized protein n=1 Tax=Elaeis guineensis var. tenera TaxID=51953 RepID=UPI003C6D5CB9